jgi:hypothetical protein
VVGGLNVTLRKTSALLVCAFLGGAIGFAAVAAAQEPNKRACRGDFEDPEESPPATPEAPALSVIPGSITEVPFERGAGYQDLPVRLSATGALPEVGTPLIVDVGQFRRGGATVPEEAIDAHAEVANASQVKLTICVDTDLGGFPAGEYAGTVHIDDPRVQPAAIAFTVTKQFYAWWFAVLTLVLAIVLGVPWAWMSQRKAAGKEVFDAGWLQDFLAWCRANVVSLILATIAAGGAFFATYWQNDSWGSSIIDFITLLGVMIVAFAGVLTAGTAVLPTKKDEHGKMVV